MASQNGACLELFRSRRRALLPLDGSHHVPRSLRRTLARGCFHFSLNRAFDSVLEGCANRPSTWISAELARLYRRFHRAGFAHSVEAWDGDELAAGMLAIAIGGCWIGETMMHRRSDAGNVLLVGLIEALQAGGFAVFDVQLSTPHLARFGCQEINDVDYGVLLRQARDRCARLSLGDDSITSEGWMRE